MRRVLVAIAAVLIAVALVVTVALMEPLPPRTVAMATGEQGGAYAEAARRYQTTLARNGVRLELRATNGGVDNLKLLRDPKSGVSIALAQGGLTTATESPDVVSLGTVFYEPVWIFLRGTRPPEPGSHGFEGRVSLGQPGSGTRALAEELLAAFGQDLRLIEAVDMPAAEAGDALLRGDLDLAVMVSGWEAPIVRRLLTAPGITTVSVPRADAQVALRPFLSKLILPRGVADLASDRPPADVQLMAAKASLLVRKDLHSAIQYLLLDAASETHAGPGIFQRAGQFPAAEPMDLPLSEAARQYLPRRAPVAAAHFAVLARFARVPAAGATDPHCRGYLSDLPTAAGALRLDHAAAHFPPVRGAQVTRSRTGSAGRGPGWAGAFRQAGATGAACKPHARAEGIRAHVVYTARAHRDRSETHRERGSLGLASSGRTMQRI